MIINRMCGFAAAVTVIACSACSRQTPTTTEVAGNSDVILVLFDVKQSRFLGRGGVFQSAEDFAGNPPRTPLDLVPEANREGTNATKTEGKRDPGAYYDCRQDVFYLVTVDDTSGVERAYELFRPCPPGW